MAATGFEKDTVPRTECIKSSIDEWLFSEYAGSDNFDANVGELKRIARNVLGYSNYRMVYRFFCEVLFEKSVDTVVALSRRAHLLLKIFLPIILSEEGEAVFKQLPDIITDKGIEANVDKIQNKFVIVLDEVAIFGRTLKFYFDKLRKIQADKDNGKIELWACLAQHDMPFFKIVEGENILEEIAHDEINAGDRVKINYKFLAGREAQKDLLYKILKLFYRVGIPYIPILPLIVLDPDETVCFVGEITTNKSFHCQKHCFSGCEHYLAYEKYDGKTIKCFRIVKNIKTGRAFLMPAILQPDLKMADVDSLFDKLPTGCKNAIAENPMDLTETKYRLISYFLEDGYLRSILNRISNKKTRARYVYHGLDEHLTQNIFDEIKNLHDRIGSIGDSDEIVEISNTITNSCQISDDYAAYENDEKNYRNITIDAINDISPPEGSLNNWEEIVEDLTENENNIYSFNALTSYFLRLSIKEDFVLKTGNKCVYRQGYDSVRYFITELADKLKNGLGGDKACFLENEIFSMLVFCLDFGILTMNSQRHNPLKGTKEYQNIGVMLRPGEQGDALPRYFVQACEYYSNFEFKRNDIEAPTQMYKDVFMGLLVKNLCEYWGSNKLPRFDHLNNIFKEFLQPDSPQHHLGMAAEFLVGALYTYTSDEGMMGAANEEGCLKIAAAVRKHYIDGKGKYGHFDREDQIKGYADSFISNI